MYILLMAPLLLVYICLNHFLKRANKTHKHVDLTLFSFLKVAYPTDLIHELSKLEVKKLNPDFSEYYKIF